MLTAMLTVPVWTKPATPSTIDREYKIKAAFIYNFLRTVEWPPDSWHETNASFRVGIIGEDPFGKQLDPLETKSVQNRRIELVRYASLAKEGQTEKERIDRASSLTESLRSCHILFICRSEEESIPLIIQAVEGFPVLLVGESHRFLENGGMFNFIPEAQKGDFEIHLTLCKRARLHLSSKLLHIAQRVIYEKDK